MCRRKSKQRGSEKKWRKRNGASWCLFEWVDEKGRIKWGRRGKKSGHLLPKNGSGVVGEVRKREKRGKRK